MFLEIFYFRGPRGPLAGAKTNWDDVTDYSKLPPGYACVASICVTIPPIVLSMAETWYTGPIAKAVTLPASPYGGDLGEFSLSLSLSLSCAPWDVATDPLRARYA
jgi:purine-cytosine permease-like protein